MARRVKTGKPSLQGDTPATSSRSGAEQPSRSRSSGEDGREVPAKPTVGVRERRLLLAAAAAALVWGLLLGALALLTANPVTLNHSQIMRSSVVVTATVSDVATGEVSIAKTWKGDIEGGAIRVEDLAETQAINGKNYVIPLSRVGISSYQVTRTPPPNQPVIYPDVPVTGQQLNAMLSSPEPALRK